MGNKTAGSARYRGLASVAALMLFAIGTPVLSARAAGTIQLNSFSHYTDSIGSVHLVGEVQNVGGANQSYVEIDFNNYDANNVLLSTDFTFSLIDDLAPGDKSPFNDPITPPAGYDHSTVAGINAQVVRPPNHNFTTTITNTFVDSIGSTHIVGTVINNNGTTADYVEPVFTFYSGATAVDGDFTFVNTGTTSPVPPCGSASFELIRPSNAPSSTSLAVMTQSPTAPSRAPVVSASPSALDFNGIRGGPPIPTQAISVSNSGGGGSAQWIASSDQPWLRLSGNSGSTPSALYVGVDPNSAVEGTNVGHVSIGGTNGSCGGTTVTVTFNLVVPKPPAAPGNVSAQPGNTSANISWVSPSDDGGAPITGYSITPLANGTTPLPTVTYNSSSTTESVQGLVNGTPYTFTVAAINRLGTGPASPSSNSITPNAAYPYGSLSTGQYTLTGSDGAQWVDIDAARLSLMVTPATDSMALISGNADLWTASAGVNQDLGIAVTGGAYPTHNGQPEAWKESGGFAGTFSPNAAFVQGVVPMRAGMTYVVKLQWKSNKPAAGATIVVGAGPIGADFSPTRLTVQLLGAAGTPLESPNLRSAASMSQFQLNGSDGNAWTDMGGASGPSIQYTAPDDGHVLLTANADLWTAQSGFNQDLGIAVGGGAYPTHAGQPEVWKESGGFAGTYSPNAAFAQGALSVTKGTTYNIKLQWKANRGAPASAGLYAGAGPIGGRFSPTVLTLQFVPQASPLTDSVSTAQLSLANSNGADWTPIDAGLNLNVTAGANCVALLGGNADLWTAVAGFNQDLAISVNGKVVAWKESGGFAGTFSPNAAFVQGTYAMSQGSNYSIQLLWKTNRAASGATIYAGAGPIGVRFSPTRLMAVLVCS